MAQPSLYTGMRLAKARSAFFVFHHGHGPAHDDDFVPDRPQLKGTHVLSLHLVPIQVCPLKRSVPRPHFRRRLSKELPRVLGPPLRHLFAFAFAKNGVENLHPIGHRKISAHLHTAPRLLNDFIEKHSRLGFYYSLCTKKEKASFHRRKIPFL